MMTMLTMTLLMMMMWDVCTDSASLHFCCVATQDFEATACGAGTPANWWNDWFREYRGWHSAGIAVQVSIQFENSFEGSLEAWGGSLETAFNAAYNYGYAFAHYFGATHGSGDVDIIEASVFCFYCQLLRLAQISLTDP